MAYDTIEKGAWSGKPIELYDFTRSYVHYRYTSHQKDLFVNAQTWTSIPVLRSNIELNNEVNRSTIQITVARDNPVADFWRISPPSEPLNVIIYQYHEDDTELVVVWMGRVINVEWSGITAVMTLAPIFTSVKRQGLRRRYQRACPHVLYGSACRLNENTFRLFTLCDSITGLVIASQDASTNGSAYYAGGYVEWEIESGVFERRYITEHTGAYLTLATLPHNLIAGQSITLYPGCDHTLATCNTRFGNTLNYGGMPYIPAKNPFGGTTIY